MEKTEQNLDLRNDATQDPVGAMGPDRGDRAATGDAIGGRDAPASSIPGSSSQVQSSYFTRAPILQVESAALSLQSSAVRLSGAANRKGMTAAQKAGKRFEEKAIEWLKKYQLEVLSEAAFRIDAKNSKRIYLDALVLNPKTKSLSVIEIKTRNSFDAFIQLRSIYFPVVQAAFPGWKVGLIELVQHYQPVLKFPAPVKVLESPKDVSSVPFLDRNVHYMLVAGRMI